MYCIIDIYPFLLVGLQSTPFVVAWERRKRSLTGIYLTDSIGNLISGT